LNALAKMFLAKCMLACLPVSVGGRPWPLQSCQRMQCGSLWHRMHEMLLLLLMHVNCVVFGDPYESSEDSFVDCDDELTELFSYLDSSLEVYGFVAFTP
jgi:hypothetical protein